MEREPLVRLGVALFLLAACSGPRCGASPAPAQSPATAATAAPVVKPCVPLVLHASRGTAAMTGELDQQGWHDAEATEPFTARRGAVASHAEARAQWDDQALYLAVYVGDDELRADDLIRIELEGGAIEASPDKSLRCTFGGTTDCKALGISAAFDLDGTVDQPGGEDEEWLTELKIPWRAAAPDAGSRLPLGLSRRDVSLRGSLDLRWPTACGVLELR